MRLLTCEKLLWVSREEIKRLYSYVEGRTSGQAGLRVRIDFENKEIELIDNRGHSVSLRTFEELEL